MIDMQQNKWERKENKPLVDNTLLEEKEWQQQYYEHLDNYQTQLKFYGVQNEGIP